MTVQEFTKELNEVECLQDVLRRDIRTSMRNGTSKATESLKVVLGEIQRLPDKEPTHQDIMALLKKLEKNEEEMLKHAGIEEPSEYLKIVRMYLPQMASEQEIISWIGSNNIDFASLKNPMQAVGIVMKEFGIRADGKKVKDIIQRIVESGE